MALPDANVVIELFALDLWDRIVERIDVTRAGVVIDDEAKYYECGKAHRRIDLSDHLASGRVRRADVRASKVARLIDRFDPTHAERLNPGEVESLASLLDEPEGRFLRSADSIVFRVLGPLGLSDAGVSPEELLCSVASHGKWTGRTRRPSA